MDSENTHEIDDGVELIDPHGGLEDLEQGVLRHVNESFGDDPLRVMRVARYAARYPRFQVKKTTNIVMEGLAPELNRMSYDRIGMEIRKAMRQAKRPSRFFEVLLDCGALAVLLPELDRATLVPAGPDQYHEESDTFEHTMMVLDRMHGICERNGFNGDERVERLLMAVAHDLGKVIVADRQGGLHSDDPPTAFGGHDRIGANAMHSMTRRLGLSQDEVNAMKSAASHHMVIHDLIQMMPGEMIAFADSISSVDIWKMLDLAQADEEGRLVDGDRPEFDREKYAKRIIAIEKAQEQVSGFEAMRTGLCDEHDPDDESLQETLETCTDCRTTGPWIGDEVQKLRVEKVQEVLSENAVG